MTQTKLDTEPLKQPILVLRNSTSQQLAQQPAQQPAQQFTQPYTDAEPNSFIAQETDLQKRDANKAQDIKPKVTAEKSKSKQSRSVEIDEKDKTVAIKVLNNLLTADNKAKSNLLFKNIPQKLNQIMYFLCKILNANTEHFELDKIENFLQNASAENLEDIKEDINYFINSDWEMELSRGSSFTKLYENRKNLGRNQETQVYSFTVALFKELFDNENEYQDILKYIINVKHIASFREKLATLLDVSKDDLNEIVIRFNAKTSSEKQKLRDQILECDSIKKMFAKSTIQKKREKQTTDELTSPNQDDKITADSSRENATIQSGIIYYDDFSQQDQSYFNLTLHSVLGCISPVTYEIANDHDVIPKIYNKLQQFTKLKDLKDIYNILEDAKKEKPKKIQTLKDKINEMIKNSFLYHRYNMQLEENEKQQAIITIMDVLHHPGENSPQVNENINLIMGYIKHHLREKRSIITPMELIEIINNKKDKEREILIELISRMLAPELCTHDSENQLGAYILAAIKKIMGEDVALRLELEHRFATDDGFISFFLQEAGIDFTTIANIGDPKNSYNLTDTEKQKLFNLLVTAIADFDIIEVKYAQINQISSAFVNQSQSGINVTTEIIRVTEEVQNLMSMLNQIFNSTIDEARLIIYLCDTNIATLVKDIIANTLKGSANASIEELLYLVESIATEELKKELQVKIQEIFTEVDLQRSNNQFVTQIQNMPEKTPEQFIFNHIDTILSKCFGCVSAETIDFIKQNKRYEFIGKISQYLTEDEVAILVNEDFDSENCSEIIDKIKPHIEEFL